MMQIKVKYFAQIKSKAGRSSDDLDLADNVTLHECLKQLGDKSNAQINELLFDSKGDYLDTLVLVVNGEQVRYADNPEMHHGDELMIMSPIAGG